jgi:predicted TIM-barrel fold metal-dependent hydrolase
VAFAAFRREAGMAIFVDTNIHVIAGPEERDRYPLNIYPGTESEFNEGQTNRPAEFVKEMDEGGLNQAYLMASRFHGFDNNYCADAIAAFPERFVGVANIDITQPDAPATISYWIQERGMHGVRFWGGGPVAGHRFEGDERGLANYVDNPDYFPAWQRIRELDIPSNAQATMPEVLPNTLRLLERIPDLKLTLNNLAHVPPDGGATSEAAKNLWRIAEYPRTYVNFSAAFAEKTLSSPAARELFDGLIEHFGPRRLIWSSFGRPLKQACDALQHATAHLSQEDREGVLGEGARDLYPALRQKVPA